MLGNPIPTTCWTASVPVNKSAIEVKHVWFQTKVSSVLETILFNLVIIVKYRTEPLDYIENRLLFQTPASARFADANARRDESKWRLCKVTPGMMPMKLLLQKFVESPQLFTVVFPAVTETRDIRAI